MKRVWRSCATWLGFACLMAGLGSCGYRAVHAEPTAPMRLAVVAAPHRAADAAALQAVLRGARAELGRAGALRSGQDPPRLVVEVLRVDELGTGISAPGELPLARGSLVAVSGRAWVEEDRGAEPMRDTGDIRRSRGITPGVGAAADALLHAEAVRSASEALGRALAQRVLGEPVPADEAP